MILLKINIVEIGYLWDFGFSILAWVEVEIKPDSVIVSNRVIHLHLVFIQRPKTFLMIYK